MLSLVGRRSGSIDTGRAPRRTGRQRPFVTYLRRPGAKRPLQYEGATISRPKRIEDITINDLCEHRWCYFHDDEAGFDSFEWVIPDTHPKFDTHVIELELATFRFHGGQEFLGMLACSQFSVCLSGKWHSFSTGIVKPTEDVKSLKEALRRLGLALPVVATAKWSGTSERFNGIRYFEHGDEVELWDA